MIKILFLLNLVYFSFQEECNTVQPENLEECLEKEVPNENIKCCYLESSYITINGELALYKDCVTNDNKYEILKASYENDFKQVDGTNFKFNLVCDKNTKNNGSYIKIGFLLILDLVIFLFII